MTPDRDALKECQTTGLTVEEAILLHLEDVPDCEADERWNTALKMAAEIAADYERRTLLRSSNIRGMDREPPRSSANHARLAMTTQQIIAEIERRVRAYSSDRLSLVAKLSAIPIKDELESLLTFITKDESRGQGR